MFEWKMTIKCMVCGKIYPNGIGVVCKKCGTLLEEKREYSKSIGIKTIFLTDNAKKVVARRKFPFGWEVKKESEV